MSDEQSQIGILVVSHGSPRQTANEVLAKLVGQVAVRLDGAMILPAFFSLASPTIEDQVAHLAGQGVRRIVLKPYFLHNGQHVSRDIPARVEECRKRFPGVEITVLPTLYNEPIIEDLLVERLLPFTSPNAMLPVQGAAIEQQSHAFIDRRLEGEDFDCCERAVVRRVIHATADFSFAETIRFHPRALERGAEAIRAGKPVLCDVTMLTAGITKTGCETVCAISDTDVIENAKARGITRAAAAMEKTSDQFEGAVVAIGNAPTALWKVLEIAAGGGPAPALVVGVPVGFVGARESKAALLESDLCYITNVGNRGGSAAAAAIVNALASLEQEK